MLGHGSLTTTGRGWQGEPWEREAETCSLEQEEEEEEEDEKEEEEGREWREIASSRTERAMGPDPALSRYQLTTSSSSRYQPSQAGQHGTNNMTTNITPTVFWAHNSRQHLQSNYLTVRVDLTRPTKPGQALMWR